MRRLRPGLAPALSAVLTFVLVACSTTSGGSTQPVSSAAPSSTAPRAAETKSAEAQHEPRVVLSAAGQDPTSVRVEVVSTDEDRQRGLMFRKQLDPDAGMLFIFDHPQELTFWMHNTYLPLDMLFIQPDMTVLGVVENATPLTDSPRRVPGVSLYVLEVNAGFCRRHGIEQGARVSFVDVAAAPTPR